MNCSDNFDETAPIIPVDTIAALKASLPKFQHRVIFYKKACDELAKWKAALAEATKVWEEHPVRKEALALSEQVREMQNAYSKSKVGKMGDKDLLKRLKECYKKQAVFLKQNDTILNQLLAAIRVAKKKNAAPWVKEMINSGGAPIVMTGRRYIDGANALYGKGSGWRAADRPNKVGQSSPGTEELIHPVPADVEAMFSDLSNESKVEIAKCILHFYYTKVVEAQKTYQMVPLSAKIYQNQQDMVAKISVIYMSGHIDEDEWKSQIYNEMCLAARKIEINEIRRTFYIGVRDVINAFSLGRGSEGAPKAGATVKKLGELINFTIEATKRCAERFLYSGDLGVFFRPNSLNPDYWLWYTKGTPEKVTEFPEELKPKSPYEPMSPEKFMKVIDWVVTA